jgi:hypothetical protein
MASDSRLNTLQMGACMPRSIAVACLQLEGVTADLN